MNAPHTTPDRAPQTSPQTGTGTGPEAAPVVEWQPCLICEAPETTAGQTLCAQCNAAVSPNAS